MFYVILDTLLKVSLNTNKTGHHFYVIPDTFFKVALNTNKTDHHVSYNVEHGDQFYWCLMPLSTMCQV
jgi:hypothetical protein